ncbi:MAG TPA: phosphoribosylaminoimidazolecarboxamide formyltransferase [Longimicrobiales bacterium]
MEIPLRYGCNPHQGAARIVVSGETSPLEVRNGEPSYINILDALTAWQLVRELSAATGKVAAASYKHVSPAGAAVAGPVSEEFARSQMLDHVPTEPTAQAYVRARGADRVSSFGDAVAVSHPVGPELAAILKREVSDCIIAPGYDRAAFDVLASKKGGRYLILEIDPDFEPPDIERRDVFGLTLEQERNRGRIGPELFRAGDGSGPIPDDVVETLVVATTALKYTQSNSVCVAWNGQVIGMAAGQQSRIHCTRLACAKAETWMLQTHPKVLDLPIPDGMRRPDRSNAMDQFIRWAELSEPERHALRSTLIGDPEPITAEERREWFRGFADLSLSSDAFIPFRDNIDRAAQTGIRYVAHAGGAVREEDVRSAAREHGIILIETGVRCFLH